MGRGKGFREGNNNTQQLKTCAGHGVRSVPFVISFTSHQTEVPTSQIRGLSLREMGRGVTMVWLEAESCLGSRPWEPRSSGAKVNLGVGAGGVTWRPASPMLTGLRDPPRPLGDC